jgi:hypothetical protein
MRQLLRLIFGEDKSRTRPTPSAPVAIDLIWEEAHSIAEAQDRRHAALDTRTTPLLGFGIAFAILLRSSPGLSLDPVVRDALTGVIAIGLLATIGVVLPRAWERVPDLRRFIEDANYEPARLKERYLGNLVGAYVHNERVLKTKFLWFKVAVLAYVVSLTVAAATTIWPYG